MNLGWRYDLLVWLFDTFLLRGTLRKLKLQTADLAQLQPGEAVLDVGCGTGALAMIASQRVGQPSRRSQREGKGPVHLTDESVELDQEPAFPALDPR